MGRKTALRKCLEKLLTSGFNFKIQVTEGIRGRRRREVKLNGDVYIYTFTTSAVCDDGILIVPQKMPFSMPLAASFSTWIYPTLYLLFSDLRLLSIMTGQILFETLFIFLFHQPRQAWQMPQDQRDFYISRANSCYDYHPNFQKRAAQKAETSVSKCAMSSTSHLYFYFCILEACLCCFVLLLFFAFLLVYHK